MSLERTRFTQSLLFCPNQIVSKNLPKDVDKDDGHMKNQERLENDDSIICSDEAKIANKDKMVHIITPSLLDGLSAFTRSGYT